MGQTSDVSPSSKPFFRYDLHTSAVEEGGQRYVDVKDPKGGSDFRFFEVEYAVACGMDGKRDIAELVSWAKSEFDLDTNAEEIGAVVSKLNELNYLDDNFGSIQVVEAAPAKPEPVAAAPAKPEPVAAAPAKPEPVAAVAEAVKPEPVAAASGIQVELGSPGKSELREPRPSMPTEAADLELGHAGRSDVAEAKAEEKKGPEVELGSAGGAPEEAKPEPVAAEAKEPAADEIAEPSKDVSTDLSKTFRLDPSTVKEAVRQSKVMAAAEVPEELKAEMEAMDKAEAETKEAAAEAEEKVEEKAEELAAGAVPSISDAVAAGGEEAVDEGAKPIELPDESAAAAAAKKAEEKAAAKAEEKKPAKKKSSSMVLWLVLLVAIGVAAAYYYMEFVREKPEDKKPATKATSQVSPKPKPAPTPPPPPTGTLQVSEPEVSTIVAGQAGLVGWMAESGSDVAEGDVIIKLGGFERFERQLAAEQTKLDGYQKRLEAAKASGASESRIATHQGNVDRKTADIATVQGKIDALSIKSPAAGVLELLVENKKRVTAETELATVTTPGSATVEFTLPKDKTAAVGDEMSVRSTEDAELSVSCTVSSVEGDRVVLDCPTDEGLAADSEVQLAL